MSQQLISRSPDLKRLQDDGYEIEIRADYLLLSHIPYVTQQGEVAYGVLVSELTLAGDATLRPSTHVVSFSGEMPCDETGTPIAAISLSNDRKTLGNDLVIDREFSSKPSDGYADYYDKMTTYVGILAGPAQAIDPDATAQTYPIAEDVDDDSVFLYLDTASSRAGIGAITEKLVCDAIAIVGLGGTGSYILDLVAKTPVKEIHLFDGDRFLQHNAFRAPGAPSIDALKKAMTKTEYFRSIYSNMRRRIFVHDYLDESTADELGRMGFVFLALDNGRAKRTAVEALEEYGVPFIDVGMGVQEADGSLLGQLRVTTSTPHARGHVRDTVSFPERDAEDHYSRNIQIADLNALNAALAVIRWKKYLGFYADFENEHSSIYQIDGNYLINEDKI